MTKFIGIISAKGGVGKTTTAINLTSALDWFKRDVIVMDANFSNPNVAVHLGMHKFDKTVHSALKGKHSLRHAIHRHHTGLKLIPGDVSFAESMNVKRMNLVDIAKDLSGHAEAVIIDSTAGLGGDCRAVIDASDFLIVVTTPDLISIGDTLRIKRLVREKKKNLLGVIVNRVSGREYEMSKESIEAFLEEKIIGIIPEDDKVGESLNYRSPVIYTHPHTPASIGFKKAAGLLIGQKYEEKLTKEEDRSMFYYMLRNIGLMK